MNTATRTLSGLISLCLMALPTAVSADTATASQSVRIIIPKIAMIDVSNTRTPLQLSFDPVSDAGTNFSIKTVRGYYDVTSNIPGLRLFGQTDIDLKNKYNLQLKVHEARSRFAELSTSPNRISTQGFQAKTEQPLTYTAEPANSNQMIPHGNIDVKIVYTLVER